MRVFVTTSFALALALVPVAALAQATTTQQPPAQQPPAAAAPAQPEAAAPKVPFTTPAGILLVQIKPDKTADFEEMVGKLKSGFAKTADETLKKQAAGFKVYKSSEPFGANTLYVVFLEPTALNTEYELFNMLLRTMTPEEQRDPGAKAMWDRYAGAFAAGLSKLSLTPVGGA
jgi:hypothetical protein